MTTIVYLVNQLRKSGPIHVLKNIITNLDRNAFRPVIIKFMRDDKVRSITNEFAGMGVEIHEMDLSFWDLELRTSYVARKLDVLLERIRPDVLHTHGYHPVIVASLLKCICPKIETLHCISTDYYISSKGYLVGNWMNRRYNKSLSVMNCCVAISNSVCDFYKEIFPSKHIQTIYNGIDNAQYCGEYDKVKLRNSLDRTNQKKTIFGRIASIIFCGTSHSRAISGHLDAAWQTSSMIRAAFLMLFLAAHSSRSSLVMPLNLPFIDIW